MSNNTGECREQLKFLLQKIVSCENLDAQRSLIKSIATELGIDILDCAAALVYLTQETAAMKYAPRWEQKEEKQSLPETIQPGIKMVRYRLDVGRKHQVTLEQLKKVLIEESGVDKNNINNVNIQGDYTLVDLPDAMPPDIFLHLKSVEINQHKLDIRRVKARNKKRGNSNFRRGRQRNAQSGNEGVDQINS
ncbi:MAG: DbpA RNA binding domain-containing protein [Methylobacter sp.]|jgi:hypothetical protein